LSKATNSPKPSPYPKEMGVRVSPEKDRVPEMEKGGTCGPPFSSISGY
jgi:hypothetical protein